MSSFFTLPGQKRKRSESAHATATKKRPSQSSHRKGSQPGPSKKKGNDEDDDDLDLDLDLDTEDEEGNGLDDDDDDDSEAVDSDSGLSNPDLDEEDDETGAKKSAAEMRLELAQRYLGNVREQIQQQTNLHEDDVYGFDAADIDRDLIAERLQEDAAEAKGKVYRKLADSLAFADATHTLFRLNSHGFTAIAAHEPYVYTATKDLHIHKWKLAPSPRQQILQRQQDQAAHAQARTKSNKNPRQRRKARQQINSSTTSTSSPSSPPSLSSSSSTTTSTTATKTTPSSTAASTNADRPCYQQPKLVGRIQGQRRKGHDKSFQYHVGPILCLAVSHDGKLLVSGGADRRLIVYRADTLEPLRVFQHHRDAVTGVVFRRGTNQLYSSSLDRTVKVWSLDELAYVETLFGHQDVIPAIDALAQERCISVGARDRTARLWKVMEETQLVFRSATQEKKTCRMTDDEVRAGMDPRSVVHEGSVDCIAMLDDDLFVTGSDSGSLSLWAIAKKKPLHVLARCHGLEETRPLDQTSVETKPSADPRTRPAPVPRSITALRAVPYSDIVLSGSYDGYIRVWRLTADKRRLEPAGVLGNDLVVRPAPATDHDGDIDLPDPDAPKSSSSVGTTTTPLLQHDNGRHPMDWRVKGIVNGLDVVERGERGEHGLCVVAAVSREHRLGRWQSFLPADSQGRDRGRGGKNGGVVFEVPLRAVARVPAADAE